MSKGIELEPQDVEELKSVIVPISAILRQHSRLDDHLARAGWLDKTLPIILANHYNLSYP